MGLCKRLNRQRRAWLLAVILCVSVMSPATLISARAESGNIMITESSGWLETAYAEWTGSASFYNVYVKKASEADSTYVQLDKELIRKYQAADGSYYYRADALGLAEGIYQLKIVPVVEEEEQTAEASVTGELSVSAHDRTGFAWVNGEANGAYRADGTLKADAIVLYITETTKDTISLDVVTNSKGTTTNGVGLQNILNLYKKGYDSRPLAIRLIGQVTDLAVMEAGDIVMSGSSSSKKLSCGITMEGVGEDATVYGWGIRIKNAANVEVRNLAVMLCDSSEGDNIGLQQDNDHIWVHNCDFFYGEAGGDSDQAKGDGALDCKKSTYVTFSYNHFFDNGKCNLLGLSEGTTEGLYITYHHNWYDHSDSRHPRVRYYSAHVYNNYYDGNAKYGIGACLGSSIFAEGNYFRNCKYPMMTSMQGSDVVKDWTTLERDEANLATFSKENGGTIKAFNNYFVGGNAVVYYQDNAKEFDAYLVSSAKETVPDTVKSVKGENIYNNFDTSSMMYEYTADSPEQAKANVESYAGRMNGGDFQWTFTEEDDESYAVNTALKEALQSYKTSLVAVAGSTVETGTQNPPSGGDGGEQDPDDGGNNNPGGNTSTGTGEHNFTESGTSSTFYTITGNLAEKGTVVYKGLTLTKCLKMESSTKISFTVSGTGKLTLVFGGSTSASGKSVKVNGVKYTVGSDQTVTVDIAAGTNEITKGDSIFLYYIEYVSDAAPEPDETYTGMTTDDTGKKYWYENGVKQGTEGRGKEIYDPATDAWYWLDAVQGGAVAAGKDVYQESNGGKWVRYDEDGQMVKGWDTTEAGTYYFDPITGAMAKGIVEVEGIDYRFDENTGLILNNVFITENDNRYWYENGIKQGTEGRGKEIYDPATDAWYWLDAIDGGKIATSKDVYQESWAGQYADREDGTGKWVRYDSEGYMVKGWNEQNGNSYYFDLITGAMVKGTVQIDGIQYYFDQSTGILVN